MRFGSVCSGVEAMSLASRHLGWKAAWLSEIEAFPSAVLAHHWPDVPNVGDMRLIPARIRSREMEAPEFFTGGTPCQAFSVAGNRDSLTDARGALSLTFCEIADAIDDVRNADGDEPCIVQWENVPGCLSTDDNAFGFFLAGLAGERDPIEPGPRPKPGRSSTHWRWKKDTGMHVPCWPVAGVVAGPRRTVAWRVVDAQYFGLAQRRERVFVVASARNGFSPGRILFEPEGLRRDTPPSRKEGQDVASTIAGGARQRGGYSTDDIPLTAGTLRAAGGGSDVDHALAGHLTVATLDASYGRLQGCSGQDANHGHSNLIPQHLGTALTVSHANGIGQGGAEVLRDRCPTLTCNHEAPIVAYDGPNVLEPIAFTQNSRSEVRMIGGDGKIVGALAADVGAQQQNYIAFSCKDHGGDAGDVAPTLRAMGHSGSHANAGGQLAVAFAPKAGGKQTTLGYDPSVDTVQTLGCNQEPAVHIGMAVRRLTPRECERLQGMPDDHTLIPIKKGTPKPLEKLKATIPVFDSMVEALQSTGGPRDNAYRFALNCGDGKAQIFAMAADGPRYKAIGNSWAVLCVSWILDRVQHEVDRLDAQRVVA